MQLPSAQSFNCVLEIASLRVCRGECAQIPWIVPAGGFICMLRQFKRFGAVAQRIYRGGAKHQRQSIFVNCIAGLQFVGLLQVLDRPKALPLREKERSFSQVIVGVRIAGVVFQCLAVFGDCVIRPL